MVEGDFSRRKFKYQLGLRKLEEILEYRADEKAAMSLKMVNCPAMVDCGFCGFACRCDALGEAAIRLYQAFSSDARSQQ